MRYICIVLIAALPQFGHSKCFKMPTVLSEFEVETCQPVEFSAGVSADDFGRHELLAKAKGILVSGAVKTSWLAWDRPPPLGPAHDVYPKPYDIGSMQAIYVHGESFGRCRAIVGKRVKIESSNMYCDVLPYKDECIVPLKQGIVVANSARLWKLETK